MFSINSSLVGVIEMPDAVSGDEHPLRPPTGKTPIPRLRRQLRDKPPLRTRDVPADVERINDQLQAEYQRLMERIHR